MGNTVPRRASRVREATGARRGPSTGTGCRRSDHVVTEAAAAPPARSKQGWDDDGGGGAEEEEEEKTTTRAGRPRAGRALRAGGADDSAAPAPALAGKVLTVKMVMTRKDAEALVARLKAQSARRQRKARMAELEGELRAGSCSSGCGASRDARRPIMLPPIKENRFERITPVV